MLAREVARAVGDLGCLPIGSKIVPMRLFRPSMRRAAALRVGKMEVSAMLSEARAVRADRGVEFAHAA